MTVVQESSSAARPAAGELEGRLEAHRSELTAYCYRMLASPFEAEDAVQETFIRAWRSYDRFEGRAALRSWLYRIATNVCLDMLGSRERRALPMDLGPAQAPVLANLNILPEATWIQPIPDALVAEGDPAEVAVGRETIRLAFVAALQHLPPRQRAVLILCEVLRWKAAEVAELLETSVASVNSALQRARATLEASKVSASDPAPQLDEADRELLARYVAAFERYDMDALTALIHEDATQSMPPYDLWLTGRDDIFTWWFGPGIGCAGSRVIPAHDGQRLARLRAVQAERERRRPRGLGPAGARALRRADRRDDVLPRDRDDLPALRAAAPSRRVGRRPGRRTRAAAAARATPRVSRISTPCRRAPQLEAREGRRPRPHRAAVRPRRRRSPWSVARSSTHQTARRGETHRELRSSTDEFFQGGRSTLRADRPERNAT